MGHPLPGSSAGRSPIHATAAPSGGSPITVVLAGHRGAGKTELAEVLLERARVVREAGTVGEGTTLLDWDPESRAHQQTLELGCAWLEWNGQVVQLLDTPGAGFCAATRDLAIGACDLVLVAVDATAGVQHGTRDVLQAAAHAGVPAVVVVTKAERAPGLLRADLGLDGAVALHLPFHDDRGELCGVVNVAQRQVLRYADDGSGAFSPEPVPVEIEAAVSAAHERLAEAVAASDDALLERYLEYLALEPDLVEQGLDDAVRRGALVPILVTSGPHRIGAHALLDAVCRFARPYTPPQGAFAAQVLSSHVDADGERYHLLKIKAGTPPKAEWVDASSGAVHRPRKFYRIRGPRRAVAPDLRPGSVVATWDLGPVAVGTTLAAERMSVEGPARRPPMAALAVRPEIHHQAKAVGEALAALVRSDPGLKLAPMSDGWVLSGVDDDHLRVGLERLLRWTGLRVTAELPEVGYAEAPLAPVSGVEGVFLERDGDGLPAAYGKCTLDVELATGEDVTFSDAMGDDEEDLPFRLRTGVEAGVRAASARGPRGFPVTGARFVLRDGRYDMLVSTDQHLAEAGRRAALAALEQVGTRVLEPWCQVEVQAPPSALGDLLSDLTAHRGRILGMEVQETQVTLTAEAPYRELRTYGARLRAVTAGRGRFELGATHFEPAPEWVVTEVCGDPKGARRRSDPPSASRRSAAGR